jgi:hypothetical protein
MAVTKKILIGFLFAVWIAGVAVYLVGWYLTLGKPDSSPLFALHGWPAIALAILSFIGAMSFWDGWGLIFWQRHGKSSGKSSTSMEVVDDLANTRPESAVTEPYIPKKKQLGNIEFTSSEK